MGRAPCCEKVGLKRGPWTPEEDDKLVSFINEHGHGSWRALPKKAGLLRCGKSCRLRWTNYLRPDIKRGEFSSSEENAILQLHALLGNRWSAIAAHLPKRTDNEIKNYWNTHLKKKLMKLGLDPITHKPLADSILMDNSGDVINKSSVSGEHRSEKLNGNSVSNVKSSILSSADTAVTSVKNNEEKNERPLLRGISPTAKGSSVTMHLTQWESVRLEAEARLTQEAKMRAKGMWRRNELKSSSCAGGGPGGSNLLKSCSIHEAAAGSIGHSVGALKSVSAVELMHALHNWEKSLQGQAGLLWPEPWRAAAATATQNSCGGHSTESSSSSSPPSIAAAAAAPTSSSSRQPIHSDNQRLPAAGSRPHSPPRKLSWSDAFVMPPKYPKVPTPHDLCKLDQGPRRGGSFSSLMLDAVLGKSLVQAHHAPSTVDPSHADGSKEELGSSDVKMKNPDKHHLDEAASNVSAVTGDMQDDEACSGGGCGGGGEEDDNEEQSVSADGTSDLFKDLPKLKRDATTTSVSYTALLSEEISDYWSNIVLKEQVSSPTIHITF